ncbi:hypothetical protein [Azonexus sp.]|uniref:hypothetical protein n=1 Tax=Azonexus sp. TaxID=1872668 RepID=UPI0035B0850A
MSLQDDDFDRGYADAWDAYKPGRPVADPQFVSEDYDLGWWNGIGAASAWHEGYTAARRGVLACPYIDGNDDECFAPSWMNGYKAAFSSESTAMRGAA